MHEPIRIGICSTYAPRACGLATFAADLENALRLTGQETEVAIIAMLDAERKGTVCAPPVIAEIDEAVAASYVAAARRVNAACDVVIVQHEFGIFGGVDGELILEFLGALKVPAVLTLHTVLPSFSAHQAEVLRAAAMLVRTVTVFTATARDLLVCQDIVDETKIRIVPHGAPSALYDVSADEARARLDLTDRFVISTFGLVSPGKGLELAIDSMPPVVAAVPSAMLVIAGRTHPGETRRNGELYRDALVAQVERLGLGEHVRFIDSFLPVDAIADVLASTDVFVTPYVNPEQIVSGALTFAVASGCPVVSTSYLYARDLLASGAGTIVESRSPEAFATAIIRYATDPGVRGQARAESTRIGNEMHWSAVGLQLAALADGLLARRSPNEPALRVVGTDSARMLATSRRHALRPTGTLRASLRPAMVRESAFPPAASRPLPFTHLRRLIDSTGIVQHATGIVPLLSSGYCVDDVARVLPLAYQFRDDDYWSRTTARSVSFIANAMDPHGHGPALVRGDRMHNFMSFDRRWIDEPTYGDHVGRAALGLSGVVHDDRYASLCEPLLLSLFRHLPHRGPIHPVGYSLLARSAAPWLTNRDHVAQLVGELMEHLHTSTGESWLWFEPSVRYDAAMLSEALLAGGVMLDDDRAVSAALGVLRWLDAQCDFGDHIRVPGHLGMGRGQAINETGDEQPLEVFALVRAHARAWEVTGDRWFRDRASITHEWFDGRNRLGLTLTDADGGCFDGLQASGVNRNQGAESTLAFANSALVVERAHRRSGPLPEPVPMAAARPTAGR